MTTQTNTRKLSPKENKWKKAKAAERRVMVARDVLKQIKDGQIRPAHGTYFRLPINAKFFTPEEGSLQNLIKSRQIEPCAVCAIGAIFYSKVLNYNACDIGIMHVSGTGRTISPDSHESIMSNVSSTFTYG